MTPAVLQTKQDAGIDRCEMNEFINEKRIVYGDGAIFIARCAKCNRFVKIPKSMKFNGFGEYIQEDNVDCKKCGRTHLIFEGFI